VSLCDLSLLEHVSVSLREITLTPGVFTYFSPYSDTLHFPNLERLTVKEIGPVPRKSFLEAFGKSLSVFRSVRDLRIRKSREREREREREVLGER
jgi:hypothetical protein